MKIEILILALVATAACTKDSGGNGALTVGGASSVIAGWKQAGLTPSAMTPDKSGAIGPDCVAGTVSGVDVVVCSFAKPEDAKAAEPRGYAWVGATTGTAIAQGPLLVAVADRRAQDPTGRTINTIAKTFRGK